MFSIVANTAVAEYQLHQEYKRLGITPPKRPEMKITQPKADNSAIYGLIGLMIGLSL